MKKVIRLTENDLVNIIKKTIVESRRLLSVPRPKPDPGCKECFTEKNIIDANDNSIFYKVKNGDTLEGIKKTKGANSTTSLKAFNSKCDMNKLKAGDVILIDRSPSGN
jgi:hypothetical protein